MSPSIAHRRLRNQGLGAPKYRRAGEVVAAAVAVQAQEYRPARWALGMRMRDGVCDADIEAAFARGEILRTHVLRPTWHFVTPDDIRWLLALTGPRVQKVMASYNRQLGLDAATLTRALGIVERALGDGNFLTRAELGERLGRAGIPVATLRLAQLMMHAELEALVCSGPRRGKQSTYALVDERAPHARRLSRDEALGEIVRRFFTSHGPATFRDFAWWSGLTMADAKRGVEIAGGLRQEVSDGLVYWSAGRRAATAPLVHVSHLLPIYDEYLIAYRDRIAVPHGPANVAATSGGFVTFQHAVVIDGHVAGMWRWAEKPNGHAIEVRLPARAGKRAKQEVAVAVQRFERFQASPVTVTVR